METKEIRGKIAKMKSKWHPVAKNQNQGEMLKPARGKLVRSLQKAAKKHPQKYAQKIISMGLNRKITKGLCGFIISASLTSMAFSNNIWKANANAAWQGITNNIVNSIQDTIAIDKAQVYEDAVKNGGFFIDYKIFKETGNIEKALIYKTNEEMQAEGLIKNVPGGIGSFVRENDINLKGATSEKQEKILTAAYRNTKGSFYGAYQYNKKNVESMILWGLVQDKHPEVKEMCKGFLNEDADMDAPELQAFKEKFDAAQQNIEAGGNLKAELGKVFAIDTTNKERTNALKCIKTVNDDNFKAVCDPTPLKTLQAWQDNYLYDIYISLSANREHLQNVDPTVYAWMLASTVHLPAISAKAYTKMQPEEAVKQIIAKEGGERLIKGKDMVLQNGRYIPVSYMHDYFHYHPQQQDSLQACCENKSVEMVMELNNLAKMKQDSSKTDSVNFAAFANAKGR